MSNTKCLSISQYHRIDKTKSYLFLLIFTLSLWELFHSQVVWQTSMLFSSAQSFWNYVTENQFFLISKPSETNIFFKFHEN